MRDSFSKKPSVNIVSLVRQNTPYLKSYFNQIESLTENFCTIKSIVLVHDHLDEDSLSPLFVARQQDKRFHFVPEIVWGNPMRTLEEKTIQWAAIGNQGFEKALETESDYILWVESDLCFPFDLLDQLIPLNLDVVAPIVYLGINFYDSWGFRDLEGRKIYNFSPVPGKGFFDGPIELSSVGSCVLFKSEIFKNSIRFRGPYENGLLAGICQDARALGYRVWADPTTCISHPTSSWRSQIWTVTNLIIIPLDGGVMHFNFDHILSGLYQDVIQVWVDSIAQNIEALKGARYAISWESDPENRSVTVHVAIKEINYG